MRKSKKKPVTLFITVKRTNGKIVHWFRQRDVVGPHYSATICGSFPNKDGWGEYITTAVSCFRCLERMKIIELSEPPYTIELLDIGIQNKNPGIFPEGCSDHMKVLKWPKL